MSGVFAERQLTSPGSRVRPTAENVRARLMEVLAVDLAGARVLDLFAGSGALGLEALSRGAARADFVENGAASLHALKANVAALRVQAKCRIFKRDVIPFTQGLEPGSYDVAFVDPPYGSRKLDRVVTIWLNAPFARVLALEHSKTHVISGKGKRYDFAGNTRVTILRTPATAG